MKKIDKSKQGKKNKAAGARFELKVRKDLESKGWIVSKWMNNVEFVLTIDKFHGMVYVDIGPVAHVDKRTYGKLIPAKHKFRGPGIPMAIGTGFPDFIAYRFDSKEIYKFGLNIETPTTKEGILALEEKPEKIRVYSVIGVEVKSNGYLDKAEKEKCKWLLENNVFSKILIASKGKKRGEIIYKEFKCLQKEKM